MFEVKTSVAPLPLVTVKYFPGWNNIGSTEVSKLSKIDSITEVLLQSCINQSEISIISCQPIRDQYYFVSTSGVLHTCGWRKLFFDALFNPLLCFLQMTKILVSDAFSPLIVHVSSTSHSVTILECWTSNISSYGHQSYTHLEKLVIILCLYYYPRGDDFKILTNYLQEQLVVQFNCLNFLPFLSWISETMWLVGVRDNGPIVTVTRVSVPLHLGQKYLKTTYTHKISDWNNFPIILVLSSLKRSKYWHFKCVPLPRFVK